MEQSAANHDVIAVGASAGGVEALQKLSSGLPGNLPAALLVTLHLAPRHPSVLDAILSRAGNLPARFATDNEPVERGRIYIAPPDHHLLMAGDRLQLGVGPRENYSRPAIDPMFRSVALCCGARAVGVVLTGTMGDGASGLWAIKETGGLAVVQEPKDAAFPEMPSLALTRTNPHHVVPLAEIPDLLTGLAQLPAAAARPLPAGLREEVAIARTGRSDMEIMDRLGRRSVFTCPDCNGIMWEIDEGTLVRYRCHVGHAYTAELMNIALDESLRRSLASALRALEERAAVARRLLADATSQGRNTLAPRWAQQAAELEREAETIRNSIQRIEEASTRLFGTPEEDT